MTQTPAAERSNWWGKASSLDWPLFIAALMIMITGVMTIYSADLESGTGYVVRQTIAAVVGLGGMLFLTLLPYQIFRQYTTPMYVMMIAVLFAVLMFGSNLRGTRGWFHIGPVYLQSSELAKLTFVLTLAGYLDRRIEWSSPWPLVAWGAAAFFPIALIIIQPDFSSSLVFFPVAMVMFYAAGAYKRHLASLCLVGGLTAGLPLLSTYLQATATETSSGIAAFLLKALAGGWQGLALYAIVSAVVISVWWILKNFRFVIPPLYLVTILILIFTGFVGALAGNRVLKDYQRKRLIAFISPDIDPLGGGYNVRQSQIAIGSGRFFGKGYGHGTQSRLGFLPSRHTDFIFSVVGEEMGFLRSLAVLLFYFLMVWRSFKTALVARDRFGGLVAVGFAAMFGFYALLNLGMTMGMAPVAGVPLPLMSYGGSSVVSSFLAIGILMSIYSRRYIL